MQRLTLIAAVVLVTAGHTAAEANPARAKKLAKEGLKRAAAGDFQGALVLFKRSLALHDIPLTQCNVGGAYYKLKRWPEAHLYLSRCLSRAAKARDAKYVSDMSKVFAKTEQYLKRGEFAAVKFSATPANARLRVSALPGDADFRAPRLVWLPTGTHNVEAKAPGHIDATTSVTVVKGKTARVEVRLAPVPVVKLRRSRRGAYLGWAVGAAAFIGGGVYYALTVDAADKAAPLDPDSSQYASLKETFKFRRIMYYSLVGAGAVATILGTYLFVRAGKTPERRTTGATITGERAIVWARWQF